MKTRIIKFALTIAIVFVNGAAMAYEEDIQEDLCKKPKYTDFTLPVYKEPEKIEVAPESEFEFKISAWSDPKTIKVSAKNENIPFTVESTSTFHRVKAKLPASLNGKFARINASVKAVLGCDEQGGWLVKVADKKPEASISVTPSSAESSPPVGQPDTPAPSSETAVSEPNPPAPETSPASPETNGPATQ